MEDKQTLASMTGFGAAANTLGGDGAAIAWAWDIRSVNSKGLELRFRMPSGWDAVEAELRTVLTKRLRRGSINANLSVKAEDQGAAGVDAEALDRVLTLAQAVASRIPGAPPPRAELLLGLPGVLRATQSTGPLAPTPELKAAIVAGFAEALAQLERARLEEGARLHAVLMGFLDDIARLRAEAETAAEGQPALQRARMLDSVRALLAEGLTLPEERIAQEVALLASRSDVREELDRLASHIDAARALLAEGTLVGRKLDFLMQEFNREANTLCSKSASVPLTAIGLSLKAVIEQLREQVQNVE
ncbi:YicC/YloC family endoribonuclease [Acidisoma silvae]|uniref:YicC family protein n=1 Tax=Acidisoma silvae TaxID=2802396 RepID=A0A964DXP9_9PROT|nr:YicC/YloC family endoribonuclease [Acidisoma silvae]MCB8873933.1 YicC family protein [Acidisoma silvae]